MAWLSGLADKAENILNKIDQNAATALNIPTNGPTSASVGPPSNTLDTMRKNLSSSTQSLKATLSPSRSNCRLLPSVNSDGGGGASSVKSESAIPSGMNYSKKVEWIVGGGNGSSRRSSVGLGTDSVAIDMAEDQYRALTTSGSKNSFNNMESQELIAFKIALNEVTNERDELRLQLSALNRDVENSALKQRTQELESLLYNLAEERDQILQGLSESQHASSAYIHSISELETNLAKIQQDYLEIVQKLRIQTKESEHQRQELKNYRTKAQRALQMKDNFIIELKARGIESDPYVGSDLNLLTTELNALKQDNQNMTEENQRLTDQLEDLHKELKALNKMHKEQLDMLRANDESLRNELRSERERHIATESEQRVVQQELQTLQQQLSNHMAAAATKLQKKEEQLQLLRSEKISKKSMKVESFGDNDARIKTLTQALVDKQNAVENITAERNALRIQLEKMHDQLQHTINTNEARNVSPRNVLLLNSTDDTKAQFPLLLRENPFDNRVARRVKRAYSSLDSAGIRLGAFLRRYPLMRVCVLMYVALLHIWVMFVLLSSTPN